MKTPGFKSNAQYWNSVTMHIYASAQKVERYVGDV